MGVVDVLMDRNADVSSGRVHVAPKIAPAGSETEEEVEVKECTKDDSLSGAQNSPKTPKVSKREVPLRKHVDEDDNCSIASSVATSLRRAKSGVTHGSAPTFRSAQRAEQRKEYYQKLEERNQALEAERNEIEQKQKEEQEAALKKLRKNLKFKAKPVPNFYYESPPARPELKKVPLTRPKSPKLILSRRKSCSDAVSSSSREEVPKTVSNRNRHSTGTVQNKNTNDVQDSPRSRSGKGKTGLKPVNESLEEACEV
ncbi:unnamed protein product [Eruca vesicaria subsp. sativa]|uniref:TPX2 C-terminal domain-containing protein n=1 Tax=Eruca vesicaria subsp. sativa TaxID=29727 RepID=A0ABC8IY11_ERUVS|nr:unnamed protein product [Eruca vesicaria subsp. sativa]